MSSIVISGDSSGQVSLTVPSAAGTNTATLPAATGTVMVSGNMPAFSVGANVGTSLSNGAYTKVLFQVVEFDTNSNFSSSRFTPTVAGYYQISSSVGSGSFGNSQSVIAIYKNGTKYKSGQNLAVNNIYSLNISSVVYLNGSTDYVEIYVYQISGGIVVSQNNSMDSWFNGLMVRAA